jgi:hypothetical protein
MSTESAKEFTEYSELLVTQHLWGMGCAIKIICQLHERNYNRKPI